MNKWLKITLQTLLGLILLMVGCSKLFTTYIPDNEEILLFPEAFRLFYNQMNATGYLMWLVGIVQLVSGILLVTQRYAFLGAMLHLPVTINILALHFALDRFPNSFYGFALLTAALNLLIVWEGREKLKPILYK